MEKSSPTRNPFGSFDWPLFGCFIVLCGLGVLTLYSSTYFNQIHLFYKQIVFMGVGIGLVLILTLIDYHLYERLAYLFYGVVVALLIAVEVAGKTVYGSQRWLPLGPIHLQPSEVAKLAVVFVLARFYSQERALPGQGYGFRELMPVFVLLGIPMFLIFTQPDLGSALMVGFVGGTIVFFCNLRIRTLVTMAISFALITPLAYQFVLKDYQRDRVKTFLNPARSPLGEGYHAIQSMITVGSGQISGKGYLKGTQSKLDFLPKHHTDFIFSSFAEEWGFIGSLGILAVFVIFILLGIDVVRKSKDKFGAVLAMGALSIIIWHVIINVGMEIGVFPVVGVPMPFFSYGGSSLITNMIAMGILMSVSLRRHIF